MINQMTARQVDEVVQVHLQAFPNAFLSFLGSSFLTRYYRALLDDPSAIAYVAEDAGQVNGFVVGCDQPRGFYKRLLLRGWLRFGLAALPALLRKPVKMPRLLGALRLPNQPAPARHCGLLISIAVSPKCHGKGIGKRLVAALLTESSSRGLQHVSVTTEAENNQAANYFYLSSGFHLYRTLDVPHGQRMNEYLISL